MLAISFFLVSLPPAANCATAPVGVDFGGLSACVGVNLGIEYHYVDIFSAGKYVVNTAESDIVSPSVTTEDPLGFLSEEVFVLNDVSCKRRSQRFDSELQQVSLLQFRW